MGYETLIIQCGKWSLRFVHNDIQTHVSIVDESGGFQGVTLSMTQAQQLKSHLNNTLPYDFNRETQPF